MTAINPARLKIQCAELVESFRDLPRFISELHDLLAFYGARIRQTSLSQSPLTLQTYQVPAPVLRDLVLELSGSIDKNPEQGLLMVDALWQEEWLEFRQLGVSLLGYLPTSAPERILDRIQIWIKNCTSEDLKRLIMTSAMARLVDEKPSHVLEFLKSLAANDARADRQSALLGLVPIAEDPNFDNLPVIYNILRDILQIDETVFTKEISGLIHSLQKKSDQETAYFLVRQMALASKPRIFRVIRQVLPLFSEESQQLLRENLSNYS
jgi:hypothetical protein